MLNSDIRRIRIRTRFGMKIKSYIFITGNNQIITRGIELMTHWNMTPSVHHIAISVLYLNQ